MQYSQTNKAVILFTRQDGKCPYCGCNLLDEAHQNKRLQIDHVIPKVLGGSNDISNLCLTCSYCNSAKNKKSVAELEEYLRPYKESKVRKKDLANYYRYKKLEAKFEYIESVPEAEVGDRIKIEYIDIILRLRELEAAYQEMRDKLDKANLDKL